MATCPYPIHPDLQSFAWLKPSLSPSALPATSLMLRGTFAHTKLPTGLAETKFGIPATTGESIRAVCIQPCAPADTPLPALIYFHGGAFSLPAARIHKTLACQYAIKTPCKVILVDYRLSPRHRFPAGLKDCLQAYLWVRKNADRFGIDRSKIAVGGDSAGGALAAGVCLFCRDQHAPLPCFQLLVYPVLDRRQLTPSMKRFVDTPLWNSRLNRQMWKMYLHNPPNDWLLYASPAGAALHAMPPTYLEVAEFDCLRDEGIDYANRLLAYGVKTEQFMNPGSIHGFEVAEQSELVVKSVARRVQALQRGFATQ